MNNNLSDVLNSIGLHPDSFRQQPQIQTTPSSPIQAVSDPDTIEAALSNSSLYATIQEIPSDELPTVENVQLSSEDCDEVLANIGVILPDNSEESRSEEIQQVIEVESSPDEETVIEEPAALEYNPPVQQDEEHHIAENSPTVTIDESTLRFSGTSWYKNVQDTEIIIAGVGGIGSNLAYQVARLNPKKIVLYDDDTIEVSNLSGQFFSKDDVGKYKVDAIANTLYNFTTCSNVYSLTEKFTSISQPADIMMCGFDSMVARRNYFAAWKEHVMSKPLVQRKYCLFLDGRLSIDTLQIFAITGDDSYNMDKYKNEYLFSDSEADETICSLKQTTYLACMIGSLMTNIFVNFIAELSSEMPYTVPFFTEYDANYMLFKVDM